jgi:hypothetical protein
MGQGAYGSSKGCCTHSVKRRHVGGFLYLQRNPQPSQLVRLRCRSGTVLFMLILGDISSMAMFSKEGQSHYR